MLTPLRFSSEKLLEEIYRKVAVPQVDDLSASLQTVDFEHHKAHEGDMYEHCAFDAVLADAAVLERIITTPDTAKWGHLVWEASGALKTLVEFYEEPTHGVSGAALATNNKNRNSSKTAGLLIHDSADDGADGNLIDCASFGIVTGQGASSHSGGGSGRGGQEWILKQNTKYLFRITSGADNNNVTLKLIWYEHTNIG